MTRAYFTAKTNYDCPPYINYLVFKDSEGNLIYVDRQATYYGVEENEISMEWRGVHVWDIYANTVEEATKYVSADYLDGLRFVEIDIEDDAPEDYFVELDGDIIFTD